MRPSLAPLHYAKKSARDTSLQLTQLATTGLRGAEVMPDLP